MQYYMLKYRLCMQHSFDNIIEHKHHHVIEIEITVRPNNEVFTEFGKMEIAMKNALDGYQNKYLNELPEFEGNTTIENIGEVTFKKLFELFREMGWSISRLEISETPLRTYAIVVED